jgi:hypothetical protein
VYVDRQLPRLVAALRGRGRWLGIVCSDHGTAYGEDGYHGHRHAHPVIWTVPYGEFVLHGPGEGEENRQQATGNRQQASRSDA